MASRSASQRRLTAPRCGRAPRGWPPPSPHLSRGLLAFGPCERASWAASAQTPTLLLPSLPWPSPPALSQRARLPRRSWAGGGLTGVEVASVRRARRSSARTPRGCARLAPTPLQYPRERTSMWALEPLTPDTAVRAVLRDITERVVCVWSPLPRAPRGHLAPLLCCRFSAFRARGFLVACWRCDLSFNPQVFSLLSPRLQSKQDHAWLLYWLYYPVAVRSSLDSALSRAKLCAANARTSRTGWRCCTPRRTVTAPSRWRVSSRVRGCRPRPRPSSGPACGRS